ncbi:MAG: HAMP domain-containing protein [Chloroflexi bacterium]|nr:MAG: HAMP domain-containing protein [Chloroflexota bacterium]
MSTLTAYLQRYPRLNAWFNRWWDWAGAVGVRTKILGIVLTLTIVLGLGVTWQVRLMMTYTLIAELEERGVSIASDLAARSVDPILLNDTFALYELLTEIQTNHNDVAYAFVVDPQGRVLAHTFEGGFPVELLTINSISGEDFPQQVRYMSNQGIMHDFVMPIFNGRSGFVRVGMNEERIQRVVNTVTGQMLLTTLLVALIGIAAATFLTWLLTRPILQLVETTRQVGQGNLNVRAARWANDEIGTLADAFNQMVDDLKASQQAIAEKEAARTRLLAQLINAQEEERRRIARELHDGVGQALTSIMVGVKLLGQTADGQTFAQKRAELRQVAEETLHSVRLLSRQLRPSVLDDLGLVAALERYAAEFATTYPNLTVDLHCHLPHRLDPPVEITLYRIVQEAMTNAARHSGATTLSVLLSTRDGRVQAIIEDNGRGFDPALARRAGNSVGLHSMTERAELLGGQVNIESGSDGTTVYVEIPQ